MQLKKSHHYFSQIMLYMAVCKKPYTDFVLWSPQETVVINVEFDATVWQEFLESSLYFYRHFIMPISVQNCLLKHQTSQQLNQ